MYTRNINKLSCVIQSPIAPKNTNVLWDDLVSNTLKVYRQGIWTVIGGTGGAGEGDNGYWIFDEATSTIISNNNTTVNGDFTVTGNFILNGKNIESFNFWEDAENGTAITTPKKVIIQKDLVVTGDIASGEPGEDITVGLDEKAVLDLLVREKYVRERDIAGLIPEVDLSAYYKATQVDDLLKKYYTSTEVDGLLSKKANTQDVYTKEELNPYKAWWDKVMVHLTVNDNGDVTIDTNLIVEGDTASSGGNETDVPSGGGGITLFDVHNFLIEHEYVDKDDVTTLINAERVYTSNQIGSTENIIKTWVNNRNFITVDNAETNEIATHSWVEESTKGFLKLENGLLTTNLKLKDASVGIRDKNNYFAFSTNEGYIQIGDSKNYDKAIYLHSAFFDFRTPSYTVPTFCIEDKFITSIVPIRIASNPQDIPYDKTNMLFVSGKVCLHSKIHDSSASGLYLVGVDRDGTVSTTFEFNPQGDGISLSTKKGSEYKSGFYFYLDGTFETKKVYFTDTGTTLASPKYGELTIEGKRVLHEGNYQEFIGSGGGGSADLSDYYTKTEVDSTFLKQSSLGNWSGSTNLVTVGRLEGDSLAFKSSKSTQSAIELYTSDNSVMVKTAMGYDMSMGGSFLYDISKDTWINIGNDNLYISNRYKVLHSGNYTDYLSGGSSADLSAYLTIDDAASTYLPLTGGVIKTSALVPLTIQSTGSVFTLQLVNSITNALGSTVGIKAQMRTISLVNGDYQLILNSSGDLLLNSYRVLTTLDLDDIGGGSGITADTLLETAIDVGASPTRYDLENLSVVMSKFGGIPSNTVFEINSSKQNFNLSAVKPVEGSNGVMYIVQGLTNTTSILSIPAMSSSNIMLTAYYNTTGSSSTPVLNYSILNQSTSSLIKFTGYFVLRLVYSYNKEMWIATVV